MEGFHGGVVRVEALGGERNERHLVSAGIEHGAEARAKRIGIAPGHQCVNQPIGAG